MSSTSKFEVAAIAPELLKLGHTELYKFSKAWKRYVNLCKERNSVLPEGQKMVPATLVSCIDPDLLENLVCLDEIEGRDDVDDVVDSDLEAWMKKSLGEVAKLSTPDDIAAMVQRKVRTNMQEKDSTMRINQLVSDYLTLSREQGWTLVKDQPKLAIKHLLSVVKPTQLKEVCENDLLLDQLQLRKDFYGFVKHLRKTAADADRWAATARTGRDTKSNDKAPAGGSTRSYTSGSSSGQRHSTTRDSTASPSKNKAPKCLNDKTCNKHGKTDYHYLKDCPHTSTETAAELLAKHRAARADKPRDAFKKVEPAKKVGRVLFKAKNTSLAKMARVEGKLDGKTIIGVLDTGATSSAVTRSFVTTLQDEGHLVSIQKMPEPFKYKLAHDVLDANGKATGETENEDFEITELCRLSPEWTLPHGPLCMRNTNFLIMEASMQDEELIIGLPELKKMGLDPVRIIDEVRENFHVTDFSDCGPSAAFEKPSKMGRMMLLRHQKCDISVNKHDPHSDEKEEYDASDDDSLPSLCSDSDSSDLEQHVVDDLELQLAYGKIEDDDPIPQDETEVGETDHDELQEALQALADDALTKGASTEFVGKLRELLVTYHNAFRLRLGQDPPASVRPLKIELKAGAKPKRIPARKYAPPQAVFLSAKMVEMERLGLVKKNMASRWASPPLILPKAGPEKFRFTLDLRYPNSQAEQVSWPMPNMEDELASLAGSKYFATLDLMQGYWQLPLHEDSQECQSIITPDGVYTPTRVQHGTTNATVHMQSIMEELMHDIRHSVKIWLDDNMIHVTDEEKLLEVLEYFFKKCLQHGLFLHAAKCNLYGTEVRYCGRIITAEGVRYDPRTMSTLQQMGTPQNGGDLVQYVAALNWMRSSLPLFAEKAAPLQDLLEVVYKEAKGRTKKKATSVSLEGKWTAACEKVFRQLQEDILTLMTTAHPDPKQRVCVFTDASDAFYSGMITQVPEHHLDLPVHDQQHQPLAFTSGRFRGSQERWTIPEKEAFAVIETVTKHSYLLLAADQFSILSDHFNLKYMYAPLSLDPSLARHTVSKIQRWALKLATYNYRIEHIAGELNVWTDLLTRWGAAVTKTTSKPRIDSTVRYGALFVAPLAMDTSNHDFPVAAEVLRLQKAAARNKALKEVPPTKKGAHGLLVNNEGKIWIPTNAVSMQVRLCVIAHCGRGGHRGHQVTLTAIQDHYYWKGMSKDVKVFVGSCFHCIASAPGETTPRPLGEALHATKPNEVIHFDYLYMGPSVDDAKYVLIVKDDYSNYVWLKQCKNADADSTAAVLIEWFAAFGVAQQWVSDQGSHFKNQVMTDIQKQLGTNHHFTTAYSPWANGTVEAVCKQTIRAARAMLSEMHLAPQEWPCVLPAIQAVLNNSPSSHRAGQTPLTAFTGHARDTPLSLTVLHPVTNQSLSFIKAQQLAESTKFALQVEQLHKEVTDKVSRQRRKQMEAHNANTHLVQPNFSPGDYVLRAEPKKVQHKLTLIWKGPYQVDKVFDNNTLRLSSLINGAQFITHVTRTRLYQDALLQTAEDLQAAAYFNNTVEFVVEKFGPLSIEKTTGELCVLTSWKGFDEAENTVEPIYDKWIDVPRMLNTHLQELADKGCELAIKAQEKIKEWENNPSDDLPGTTGDTYPDSYHYGSTNVHYL